MRRKGENQPPLVSLHGEQVPFGPLRNPGAQLAQRTPMGRILDPSEIADLAVYLGSDESSGMTGQTMAISNGMRMS